MNFLRALLASLLFVSLVSIALQADFKSDNVRYSMLTFKNDESYYQSVYSPSAASVKVSVMGSGRATLYVRDLELNQTMYSSRIYGSEIFSLVFPHSGYYEFFVNSTNASYSITLTPIETGFPTENWNFHFIFASLVAFSLAFLIWRDGHDN